ncbi:MAG TPA: chorismate lyase [Gammaproteobacteria bacterium]|nr:chorismate lyase [Gammaproteobacteria bacterium]
MENASRAQIWRTVEDWPAAQRPAALWPLIAESGSLTERLRDRCGGQLQVQVLAQGHASLHEEDTALLGAKPDEAGYVRQVFLCGREQPWVYARSLVAGAADRWLKHLGERPLGDQVFSRADARRGAIEAARLDSRHALYKEAVAHLPSAQRERATGELWARRSLLSVEGVRILIYECFLPGLAA